MMNRSMVTTDTGVCFTSGFLGRDERALEPACGIRSRIDLVAVSMVPATQAFPNVAKGERPALQKLLDVAKLVQKQRRVERSMGSEEYCSPQSYRGNRGLTQHQASDSGRKSASAKPHLR